MLKHFLKLGIGLSILFISSISSFGYAQQCDACSTTPDDLDKYFTAMDNMIKHMQDFQGKKPVESDTTELELTGEPDPLTGIIQTGEDIKMAVELERQISSKILINNQFTDQFTEIKILDSGKPRKRDRDILKKKDQKIREGVQKMQTAGYVGVTVPNSVLTKIDNELKSLKYLELGKIQDDYVMFRGGVKYEELAKMLRQLNALYKELHAKSWYHNQLKDISKGNLQANVDDAKESLELPVEELFGLAWKDLDITTNEYLVLSLSDNKGGENLERIQFKDNKFKFFATIWQIQADYACSYGVRALCSSRAETARESWADVKDVYHNDGDRAKDTFKVAFSRLKGALFMASDEDKAAAQQRENQLLNSIYGRDIPTYKKRWLLDGKQLENEGNVVDTPIDGGGLKSYLMRRVKNKIVDVAFSGDETPRRLAQSAEWIAKEVKNEKVPEGKNQTKEEKEQVLNGLKKEIEDNNKYTRTDETLDTRSILKQSSVKREIVSFRATFDSMMNLQKELEEKSVLVDPIEFTKQFPKLSQAVYTNINYVGDKDSDDMIYHSMGNVCEIQCGDNVQGKCRYHTN